MNVIQESLRLVSMKQSGNRKSRTDAEEIFDGRTVKHGDEKSKTSKHVKQIEEKWNSILKLFSGKFFSFSMKKQLELLEQIQQGESLIGQELVGEIENYEERIETG